LLSLLTLTSALPRGAHPNNAHLYTEGQFQCADGTQNFPISFVNDDYCDCNDGSDEPGTSACSNGHFFCINKGFKGTTIASSRVDDTICDCCDGSDEKPGLCSDNCQQLGAHLQAEAKRIRREQAIGFQTRLAYSADGKSAQKKRQDEIAVLQQEVDNKRAEMEKRQEYMAEVEKPAIEAKEAVQAVFDKAESERSAAEAEESRVAAEAEYTKMDTNGDGDVTSEELLEYSSSADSHLPHEEVKLLVEGSEVLASAILDLLQAKISAANEEKAREIKEQERQEKRKRAKKPKLPVPIHTEEEGEEEWGEDGKLIKRGGAPVEEEHIEEEEEEDEYEEEEAAPVVNHIQYSEETQRLVDVYEEAQAIHNTAKEQHDAAERQMKQLKKVDELDFGPDQEYYALNGQCYTFTEKYNYKLCPFDKSEQDGTSLGRWEGWVGDKYSMMKYSKGQGCWNGPARSTTVEVVCGTENELISASEPAKCEYHYTFKTPAACHKVQEESEIHDEL